jgi:hypothetical protein
MAGGVAAIAGTAAGTAVLPIVACAVVGAIVLGGLGWGAYRISRSLCADRSPGFLNLP